MREEILSVDIVLPVADPLLADEITWAILETGVQGFEQHDDETFSLLVDEARPLPKGAIRWRINIDDEDDEAVLRARFEDALEDFPDVHIEVWRRDVTGYRTAWMEHFRPTQVSERILIHPPWDQGDTSVPVRIEIDPGMAFGTGTHETTRLCLKAIDALGDLRQKTALDVGMGSGILSIAAAKLGAAQVYGMDIDADSTREAIRNANTNGVGDRCSFRTGELDDREPAVDLVIANILPHVLIAISDALIGHMLPQASLILSGILVSEAPKVEEHFQAAGLRQVNKLVMNDWCAIVFTHA